MSNRASCLRVADIQRLPENLGLLYLRQAALSRLSGVGGICHGEGMRLGEV